MMPVSMVGRHGELAELRRAWRRVTHGRRPVPRTVVITGAAGVGKSLLVAAGLDGFAPRPRIVLSGAARVHEPAPYDWLAAVLSCRDTHELPLPADALAWLAQQPNAPRERYAPGALLRLAVRAVRLLVGTGPAVVIVEDLHALDPASLNLVGELAAAPDLPVLVIVASRPPSAAVDPHLTARTLARLSGAPGAVRQHLGPLSRTEVAEVLAQVYESRMPPPPVVDVVWQRTGGNPYWLTELLAAHSGQHPEALARQPLPEHLHLPAARTADPARVAGTGVAEAGPVPAVGVAEAELTGREIEVLGCLAAGMSNKQVARSLGISVRTVTVHVSNLLRKTGSASRTEAALWAVQRRLPVPAPRP
ncbi:AAA family ATPase [Micromonospora sp. CPCC 206060]|uniref:response regulator transcription factor n=1 Tax=Micromonospora sp. CPCC 206060 TaxID=3122406 RepID=UPI002FF3BA7F